MRGFASSHPAGCQEVVAPSTPFDYVGLMNTALRCNDPVLVIEHVELFQTLGPQPKDDPKPAVDDTNTTPQA